MRFLFYFHLEKKNRKLIIQRGSIILPYNKKRFQWRVSFRSTVWKCKLWEMKLRKNLEARPTILSRYYAWFRPLYCEKWKTGNGREIYIRGRQLCRTDLRPRIILTFSLPFLITVFHLKSLPPYHETSCISLFMYEKWFKAARESTWEKIRVAISKASFPGSGSLHP